jgi:hypothetical protein
MCGLPRWGSFHDPLLVVRRLDFVADNAAFVPALHLSRIGVGLVVVVLVDAAIARAVVLAATMKAAGVWNWYPTGLARWLPGRDAAERSLRIRHTVGTAAVLSDNDSTGLQHSRRACQQARRIRDRQPEDDPGLAAWWMSVHRRAGLDFA